MEGKVEALVLGRLTDGVVLAPRHGVGCDGVRAARTRLSEARNAGGVGASGDAADGGEARTAGAGRGRPSLGRRRGRVESPWSRGSTARPTLRV